MSWFAAAISNFRNLIRADMMFRCPEYQNLWFIFILFSSGLWGQILPKSKKRFCPSLQKEFFFSSFLFSYTNSPSKVTLPWICPNNRSISQQHNNLRISSHCGWVVISLSFRKLNMNVRALLSGVLLLLFVMVSCPTFRSEEILQLITSVMTMKNIDDDRLLFDESHCGVTNC